MLLLILKKNFTLEPQLPAEGLSWTFFIEYMNTSCDCVLVCVLVCVSVWVNISVSENVWLIDSDHECDCVWQWSSVTVRGS